MKSELTLDHDDAWTAVATVRAEMERRHKPLVVAVVDPHGDTLCVFRHSDAMLSSVSVATNKAYTAARLRRPSGALGQRARNPDEGFNLAYFSDPRIVGFGGGVPVEHDGQILGAVGISGLSESEDVQIAEAAIQAIKARWQMQ